MSEICEGDEGFRLLNEKEKNSFVLRSMRLTDKLADFIEQKFGIFVDFGDDEIITDNISVCRLTGKLDGDRVMFHRNKRFSCLAGRTFLGLKKIPYSAGVKKWVSIYCSPYFIIHDISQFENLIENESSELLFIMDQDRVREYLLEKGTIAVFKIEVIEETEIGEIAGRQFSIKNHKEFLIFVSDADNSFCRFDCEEIIQDNFISDSPQILHIL